MAENPRIEELRRRVQKDPASIAFAQLAEEYRRAGNYEEAIAICRTGLHTHPSYLSARVTLGRALLEMNDLENAETELRYVLDHAAENLAAIRAMAEIHQRRGELSEALGYYKGALELARHDPDLEQTVDELSRSISKAPAPVAVALPPAVSPALTAEQATAEFLAKTFDLLELDPIDLEPVEPVVAAPVKAAAETELSSRVQEDPAYNTPVQEDPAYDTPVQKDPAYDIPVQKDPAYEPELQRGAGPFGPADLPVPADQAVTFDNFAQMDMPMAVVMNPALPGLERFLDVIHSYRLRRAV